MPSYTRPGVYVEESLAPLAQSVNRPGEATAAFVGSARRGPVVPTVVGSWRDYVKVFGDLDGGNLGFAVWMYFANGGRSAWVARAVADNSDTADVVINNLNAAAAFTVRAANPGVWGNEVYVTVSDPAIPDASRPGRFDFVVKVGGTDSRYIVERFTDLSLDPDDSREFGSIVNSPTAGSKFVSVAVNAITSYNPATHAPDPQTDTVLTGGSDGTTPNLEDAIDTLEVVEDVLVLNIPGVTSATTIGHAQTLAETLGTIFVVVDSPAPVDGDTSAEATADIVAMLPGGASPLDPSSLLAVYGPHLIIADPRSSSSGATVTVPAGGAVVGKFIATDALKGVQKPAAGIGTSLSGVVAVATRFTNSDQDALFAGGFNVIKAVPGAGFVIWGARTLAQGTVDRAVSIRRTLLQIKAELVSRTRFAVFESNTPGLWDTLENVCQQYLNECLQAGMLKGGTPDLAFYVKCDEENNPAVSVANGEVHVEVGVALAQPAEFVVIEIGQFDGAVVASEEV
jgi:phage tail sheath protein FI